ncbi:TPA: hypothetical protein DEQ95_04485 [Candidatus Beckwithbacteria bacterium]|nr:MAG: Oxidoreductase FAD-binding domain-containing protein, Na+-transporting NADH:ubiquinone oxidoreductase subunit F [Candidatus Beckwithbacteria bacterium GW2011_GWC1_49_16]KKU35028.1 MAG: Oxidoreductase FAD-binding domain protein [Candidatus Beckwithbacteria bacterium GW2011_GWA1_46_30]KKU71479.1 MAG: Oxidoreductase FAD-binding domain protein [Candidatus Beckwithbacteria bacterium GW2011_GWA2_47_25]OGD48379.1 MAG: hypothetical protein A2877_02970 [Candidatus Beckwithbacteria bacterium RIFCS
MQKPQQFTGKVAEHILINNKFQYLHIELTHPFRLEFEAGQYVSFAIGGGERRSYSIASEPQIDSSIEVCVDVTPEGKGSSFLKSLKPGDEVSFLAPLGKFKVEDESKLLFVATGSGITPVRSMILDLLEYKKDPRQIQLHWGLRHVDDMFWVEHFRKFHEYYDNFTFHLTLSQPPEHWPLCAGYVTDCVRDELTLDSSWGVYLCGNKFMIDDATKLVTKMGVPPEQIHTEKFF